jgi:threonine/homoserine/homoserine lactone efflux protein
MTAYFVKGLLIGFSIAAPVGPIGVLCIRRTLADGRIHGLVSGLGAATADAVYGSIAGFGLTIISAFLLDQQIWIRLVGGAFLCFLGLKTFFAKPSDQAAVTQGRGLLSAYVSTFFLTLTNPMTILSFAAISAGLGLGAAARDYASAGTPAGVLIMGVFLGSATWWFLLSGGVSFLRRQFGQSTLRWVNRVSGLVILGFGVAAFWSMI